MSNDTATQDGGRSFEVTYVVHAGDAGLVEKRETVRDTSASLAAKRVRNYGYQNIVRVRDI